MVLIKNSVAVVAGGSQGAGLGISKALAKRGAKNIVILARRKDVLQAAEDSVNELTGCKVAQGISVDLNLKDKVEQVGQHIMETHGVPDIVVYSAGQGNLLSIEEETQKTVLDAMSSTYFGAVWTIGSFIERMLIRNSGHIVIVGSPTRILPLRGISYTSSRFALYGFVEALQLDLKETNIKVTYVEPGRIHEGHYFENNPGTLFRLPFLVREIKYSFLHQNVEEVGGMVIKSIEKDAKWCAHWSVWALWMAVNLGLSFLVSYCFNLFRLPSENGGWLTTAQRIERLKTKQNKEHRH